MHIAIGYRWFDTALGFHMERALLQMGHTVTYVGLPAATRPGYDTSVPISDIIDHLPTKPDLFLWIDPAGPYFPACIESLPIPTACYLIDVHLGSWRLEAADFFDAVFIAQKDYLDLYRKKVRHHQVYWLPLAAAPDVHGRTDLPRIYDVGFVGNLAVAHRNTPRARRLRLITSSFRTNDFYVPYTPQEVGRVYSQSRIVFNTSIAGDVTMRVFEGTMAGALVLTDSVANGLDELFRVGKEIVVYENDRELRERIDYFLSHEEERAEIARAGHVRSMGEHTYSHRCRRLLDLVSHNDFARLAPMRSRSAQENRKARHEIYTHLHMVDAILYAERDRGAGPFTRAVRVFPALLRRLIF
jgi:hypothetical protein